MRRKPRSLKKNIIYLLVLGWVVPVLIMTMLLATYVERKANEQIRQTVVSSMEKANEIFDLELAATETASKNASYYSNIRSAYQNYILEGDIRSFNSEVNGFLNSEYKYNKIIKSAVLVFPGEDMVFHTYNNSAAASYKNIESFLNDAKEEVLNEAENLKTDTMIYSLNGNNYMVRNLVLPNFKPYAVLSLEMNDDSFMKGFQSVWGYDDAVVLLGDSCMMGNESMLDDPDMEKIKKALGKSNTAFLQKWDYSLAAIRQQQYGEEITSIVRLDNSVLYQRMFAIWLIFGLIIVVMIPLTIIIFRFFRKNVTEPMDAMIHGYDEVANKNYGYQIREQITTSEFIFLQESFNQMSHQIKEQFDKIYREEISLRDAKIMALQSQINPHFLNNTFEIINWEARLNGNIKVSRMIEALSTMLEATMNRRGDNMHVLSEEISYVDAYAYIISERLGDKFTYVKEIDESLLDVMVPKLIVQPIVENAVEHGLSEVQEGNIRLHIFGEEEFVVIEIINDGSLSEENKVRIKHLLEENVEPEKEKSLSLGIRNVNNRLRLIYGDDCGLFIESRDGKYTVSTIRLKHHPVLEQ